MSPSVNLQAFALDCEDAVALAEFYAALLGAEADTEDPEWTEVAVDGGVRLAFQKVAEHRAPRWPDPVHPQQAHLDFGVPDLEAAEKHALALGASFVEDHVRPDGTGWRVYTDPAGHPFCLCVSGRG
ncbi:VOC family protein [Streptacidiphilus sp. ASG 303]|uniref:VOC family protein n=1 Tax=Streptacidiphilus sp. ASG 303 TaxID=2896847 RepID=UPI001E496A7C|nr:VOC family protein [Streptacidiphilus sp. ASG 303]MCD0485746.1 VOC family protein [Streptacidiphilus sp. ASG 303]